MTKEELKQEAKNYAEENKMDMIDYHDSLFMEQAYLAGAESREKRIAELETENTELNDKNKALEQYADLADAKVDEVKIELIKAKAIIRQLCSMVRELNKPNVQLTNVDYSLAEAEQFLKENEE